MKLFDFNDPFFKPFWLRLAVVVVAGAWGAFEFLNGETLWGTVFVGIACIAFWGLFVTFEPREKEEAKKVEASAKAPKERPRQSRPRRKPAPPSP